jgi:hypothetical protein
MIENAFARTASFFQTDECYRFYRELPFLTGFRYTVDDEEGTKGSITGYLIAESGVLKRFLTKRAIIPGGALLHKDITEQQLNELLIKTREGLKKKGAIYSEFRNYNDYESYKAIFEKNGFIYQPHLNFHVYTPSLEAARSQLTTTKRRDIKLAINQGVRWELSHNINDMREFYSLLLKLYTVKIKTPLFPLVFFEKLIEYEWAKFFVVKYQQKVMGGSICVAMNNSCLYEWFVCGEDHSYKKTFPSTVATWAAIEYAATNGFEKIDMMGAGKPNEGYGVREFKSRFGGELVEHGRFLCVNRPFLYQLGKIGVSILKRKK